MVLKKIRVILLLVVFALACLAVAGCGGDKDSQSTSGQNTAPPAKEESIADLFAKGKKIEGMSFDYVVTAKDSTMNGKMWLQGDKVKSETTVQNQTVVMIVDGQTLYTYQQGENMAVKFSLNNNPEQNQKVNSPYDYTDNVDTTAVTTLETTVYDGASCKVLLVKEKATNTEFKMWVREDYGIPVKIESTNPDGSKEVVEYKNIKVGPQPADMFKLPQGVQVQDMSEMMKNMPQGAGGNQ